MKGKSMFSIRISEADADYEGGRNDKKQHKTQETSKYRPGQPPRQVKYVEEPDGRLFEFQSKNQMRPYLYTYQYYYNFIENLYYEKGEGEISVFINYENPHRLFMVTCIDISTLYVEKRGKAFEQITKIAEMKDPSLVQIHNWWNIED